MERFTISGTISETTLKKFDNLKEILSKYERAAVAFSGGADSTFLLKTAKDILGKNIVAFTAKSVLQPEKETEATCRTGLTLGISPVLIPVKVLDWPRFTANPKDRCYHCKKKIYSIFLNEARQHDCSLLLDGTNSDDRLEARPGHKAVSELGVLTPLQEAGLTKPEIRQLSREMHLPTWNRPSGSCLATRIPPGVEITSEKLALISRSEMQLHTLGFSGCRVRLAGPNAHIELQEGDNARLISTPAVNRVMNLFKEMGFQEVLLNLRERRP